MQTFISLLVILPILAATSLKIIPQTNQQTYAEYAQENGIAIALTKSNLKADYQYLDCYDNFGQGGQSLRVSDYISDLRSSGFDNRFSSCCFYGIWTLYQSNSYNGKNAQRAAYNAWGENYCTDLQGNPTFNNQASSVRFVGAPDGYKYDTINLYQHVFYGGVEQYTYGDASSLNYDNLGSSAIVTGCSAWTVYEGSNYQGRCQCLYPSDQQNCYPGFYKTLEGLSNQISSVRRNCYCNKKILPDNHVISKSANGQIGQVEYFPGNL